MSPQTYSGIPISNQINTFYKRSNPSLGLGKPSHTRPGRHAAPPSGLTMFDKLGTWPDDFTGLIVYISTSNANKIQ